MDVDAALLRARILRLFAAQSQDASDDRIMPGRVCAYDLSRWLTPAQQGTPGQAFANDVDDFKPPQRSLVGAGLVTQAKP